MALMDIFNSIVGGGAPAPDVSMPAGGEGDVMSLMKQYMVDAIPRPEDDFRKQLAHALIAGGKGMATTPGNFGAGLVGGLAPGTAGFVDKGEALKDERYKGAAGVLQRQLQEDKLTQQAEQADERARLAQEKLDWMQSNAEANRAARMEQILTQLSSKEGEGAANRANKLEVTGLQQGGATDRNNANITSREKIAEGSQAGQDRRTAATIEGQAARLDKTEAGKDRRHGVDTSLKTRKLDLDEMKNWQNSKFQDQRLANEAKRIDILADKAKAELEKGFDPRDERQRESNVIRLGEHLRKMQTAFTDGIDPTYQKEEYAEAVAKYSRYESRLLGKMPNLAAPSPNVTGHRKGAAQGTGEAPIAATGTKAAPAKWVESAKAALQRDPAARNEIIKRFNAKGYKLPPDF